MPHPERDDPTGSLPGKPTSAKVLTSATRMWYKSVIPRGRYLRGHGTRNNIV